MIGLRKLADDALATRGLNEYSDYVLALDNESKWANRTIKEILSSEGVSQYEHRKIYRIGATR